MYNLIEYSYNYTDTSGSLWQFTKDTHGMDNNGNPANVTTLNSTSFEYKSSILGCPVAVGDNGVQENAKIIYLIFSGQQKFH